MIAVHALDHVTQQLWAPAFARSDALRAVVDPEPEQEWRTLEAYWLLPNARSARLLVPCRPRRAAMRLLTNYRRLRPATTNVARSALGATARLGAPLSSSTVALQVRTEAPPGTADLLPVAQLSAALGQQVYAATGVRTSDNRKTTLHLVDAAGRPVGYAKFGWDAVTDELVATEGHVLAELGGRPGRVRAPRLLARLDYLGHPVIVTEPLPTDARGSSTRVPPPTSEELFALTPVVRLAPIGRTAQLRGVSERLLAGLGEDHVRDLAGQALVVAERIAGHRAPVPVTARWHGDLAPWNRARDATGQLWVWDWESSEPDAVAGLDALHWAFSTQRLAAADVDRMSLAAALAAADPHLAAIGVGERERALVAATYAVTVVERACTIARHSGTWDTAFISPDGLSHLLREAVRLHPGASGAPRQEAS